MQGAGLMVQGDVDDEPKIEIIRAPLSHRADAHTRTNQRRREFCSAGGTDAHDERPREAEQLRPLL